VKSKATVGQWTEDKLIRKLLAGFVQGADVDVGPGDDCAVVQTKKHDRLLWKTDCVIEEVHFRREMGAAAIGRKAMARCVSDFAAMAGTPRWALVTVAIPETLPQRFLQSIYRGIRQVTEAFGVSLVGGETSRSPGPIFLNVALAGLATPGPILRSGSQVGDAIFVTGRLGGSFASGRHLRFTPRLEQAHWLARQPARLRPTAMMDLSDGLASDLPRLSQASGIEYRVQPGSIPRHRGVTLEQALTEGEDYELLFTSPGRSADSLEKNWAQAWPQVRLTRIGEMVPPGVPLGQGQRLEVAGFAHFSGDQATKKAPKEAPKD
jgi:thiamine-monophosphate kinase